MVAAPPRTAEQRLRDTLDRLAGDVDLWLASADPESGMPYLVPLSFLWDGEAIVFATPAASRTARNLQAVGRARIGVGPTRDVVMVEGVVEAAEPADSVDAEFGDAFAAKAEFDPRPLATPYLYFRIRPVRVQAWREANEIAGRDLMRDGKWLAG
ncbi:pyridoxamine 5'-phosphate oxidase family protein [Yinghuangia soli]|uniref:Pyridoxamine 5'-phosphate oxidase family protein n=1 Tax=Yinghuangia soli TaxID=2908204 RepID=A0AA41U2H9_9ACTN|nr:pyridoxamine 5'-phosphate oxidase family protein [Yinghuangia soli]MCF2530700.1 pyridoxamine 5'-phosphate oxidase family protein [Yinghuangia soli]